MHTSRITFSNLYKDRIQHCPGTHEIVLFRSKIMQHFTLKHVIFTGSFMNMYKVLRMFLFELMPYFRHTYLIRIKER